MTKLPLPLLGKTPLILYELNEVPWRVIDWYVERRPRGGLAAVLRNSLCLTTRTRDTGELHPWSTWPTLHRGVDNRSHNILFLNQDRSCAEPWPPVWEEAADAGLKVGVCGSLQSYPVPPGRRFAFYVPDTFAPGPETHPPRYSVFQRFNLRRTRADGAEASAVRFDRALLADAARLMTVGVSLATYAELGAQLIREKLNKRHRSRRAMLQAPVAFDVFWHALSHEKPDFATFFTNHVAGAMHRYWKYAFPEDFGHPPGTELDRFHRDTLVKAMDIADRQIARLKAYVDARGGQLVIASSMGQEAIDRGAYHGEMRIADAKRFARAIGFPHPFTDHLAMQPDFNFEFRCEAEREQFCAAIARLVNEDGEPIFKRVRWQGATLNLGLRHPPELIERQVLLIREDDSSTREIPFAEAGIRTLRRDPGTGYHQPRGSLIWYRRGLEPSGGRAEIDSSQVKPMLLQALGVEPKARPKTPAKTLAEPRAKPVQRARQARPAARRTRSRA